MKTLFVIVLICSASDMKCDVRTARAYQAYRAPQGIIICGVPAALPVIQTENKPAPDEWIKTKCVLE